MEIYKYLLVVGVGMVAGFVNTVAGGGSLLTLPVLIFMGLPPALANGTNRVGILLQNVFAVSGFRSKGVSVFPYAIYLAITALVGAVIGAKLAVDIKGELFNRILAVVMVFVLFITIFNPFKKKGDLVEMMDSKRKALSIFLYFFVGLYGGFIQAGIGFIMIAVLTTVNGLSMAKTNSIKVFVVLVYTFFAIVVFVLEDKVNWTLGLTLALGTSAGGWIASRWSADKDDKLIRIFLIVAVSAMAVKLWFF
ncbi:MAG: sulfite exporter TauE/SafE family protein [Cyclobacteriaceae bacterium]